MEFIIGADPEIFVSKNGKPVSAAGFVPGTKDAPLPVERGALQVDGMALEFNINPAKDREEFWKNIHDVVTDLKMYLPEGHKFKLDPVAHFGAEYIAAQPKENRILGCSPDYNGYTTKQNPLPDGDMPFRTTSGHIHVGWTKDVDPMVANHYEAACWAAKQLDYSVGILSLFFGKPEVSRERRNLYGRAGAFRPKSYGMEYRTTDSYWLQSKKHAQFIFDVTMESMKDLADGYYYFDEDFAGVSNAEVQRIINEVDLEAAEKLIKKSPVLAQWEIPANRVGTLLR